jgi:hypothetical protein
MDPQPSSCGSGSGSRKKKNSSNGTRKKVTPSTSARKNGQGFELTFPKQLIILPLLKIEQSFANMYKPMLSNLVYGARIRIRNPRIAEPVPCNRKKKPGIGTQETGKVMQLGSCQCLHLFPCLNPGSGPATLELRIRYRYPGKLNKELEIKK